MSNITLYGISNCDTVKKARTWLDTQGANYTFHDFRKDGITEADIKTWVDALGWEGLINKRSTTWKQLDDAIKAELSDNTIIPILLKSPTLIKRPLLAQNGEYSVGFKAADYEKRFA